MIPFRVGLGYDSHRLVEGRPLILGGITVPHTHGLLGHSDADVLLHALCDSLLGAAGMPDIGNLYPNTDPRYAGAPSLSFLTDVRDRLRSEEWAIQNVDTTLIAERPKIAKYVPAMKSTIAQVLEIDESRIGIKATTQEGIGSLGAGEGIACHAVASIARRR